MGAVIQMAINFEVLDCSECGTEFAMIAKQVGRRREDGKTFHCPNGHPQVFVETEVMRLRKQNERLEREKAWAEQRAKNEQERADHNDRRRAAAVGQLTKERKRVGHGVCPCCNRTFQQLARHMKTKHPDFAGEPESAA